MYTTQTSLTIARKIHGNRKCVICDNFYYPRKPVRDLRCAGCAEEIKSDPEKDRVYRECITRIQICRKYGLPFLQYFQMALSQKGLCAICHQPEVNNRILAIDHDHGTGKVRALLCMKCNTALGQFCDSPELLSKAVEYLYKHPPLPADSGKIHAPHNKQKQKRNQVLRLPNPKRTPPSREVRVVSFIKRWADKNGKPPTMREIRQNVSGVPYKDLSQILEDLLQSGIVCKIPGEKTTYYGILQIPEGFIPDEIPGVKPLAISELSQDEVEIRVLSLVLRWESKKDRPPTMREIGQNVSIPPAIDIDLSQSVSAMVESGLLHKVPGRKTTYYSTKEP